MEEYFHDEVKEIHLHLGSFYDEILKITPETWKTTLKGALIEHILPFIDELREDVGDDKFNYLGALPFIFGRYNINNPEDKCIFYMWIGHTFWVEPCYLNVDGYSIVTEMDERHMDISIYKDELDTP